MLPCGCRLCLEGKKLVLFVTGMCGRRCYFCPLSTSRKGRDVVYANERPVFSDEDVLEEARLIDAEGTGITGGDPILCLDRTLHYATLLKRHFSPHHIHLYTTGELLDESIYKLLEGTIDELRLHTFNTRLVASAMGHGFEVGVEVPVFPDGEERLRRLILKLDSLKVPFINLNELEYAEGTLAAMHERGYKLDDSSNAVCGSQEVAQRLTELPVSIIVHYCSSGRKDGVQLRNRLRRRAMHIKKSYEEIDDCLLVRGVFECGNPEEARELRKKILDLVEVPGDFVEVSDARVYTHQYLVEEFCDRLLTKAGIEKYYPTHARTLVEYTPLFPQ